MTAFTTELGRVAVLFTLIGFFMGIGVGCLLWQ